MRGPIKARKSVIVAAAALSTALVGGCASTSDTTTSSLGVDDRFEGFNRGVHGFNKGVDEYVVRPVAIGYDTVTPGLVQFLLRNAISHLELPRDFAANLFSGELEAAGLTLVRFGVNTLVGAGGLLDPATDFEVPKQDADFGKTFASWGADEGPFHEIPFVGPSTIRHTAGRIVDMAFAPTSYLGQPLIGVAKTAVEVVDFRAQNGDLIDDVLYESADSYSAEQTLYIQNRRAFVSDGDVDIENAPDFGDTSESKTE